MDSIQLVMSLPVSAQHLGHFVLSSNSKECDMRSYAMSP